MAKYITTTNNLNQVTGEANVLSITPVNHILRVERVTSSNDDYKVIFYLKDSSTLDATHVLVDTSLDSGTRFIASFYTGSDTYLDYKNLQHSVTFVPVGNVFNQIIMYLYKD